MMQILRRGLEGPEVVHWQHFLLGQDLLQSDVDGRFGPKTEQATREFQKRNGLEQDGAVGPLTYAAALQAGFDPHFVDPLGGTSGVNWPPHPIFAPLVSNAEREAIFGQFRYRRVAPDRDDIVFLDDWEEKNVVTIQVKPLSDLTGGPKDGKIRVHRLAAEQIKALFAAWKAQKLLPLLLTWGGGFVPRFVRGSKTNLSNHAWGAAFDVNAAWNPRGAVPVVRGREGSVRELVPIANELGFYWGGHFSYRDGMHFELTQVAG
jgi:hypothetical protein